MSTFSKAGFNAVAYASCRPQYPPTLYAHILNNFGPAALGTATKRPTTLLDLGCGPGLSTFEFVKGFDHVVGLDPGAGMVKAAQGIAEERTAKGEFEGKQIEFKQGQGEKLAGVVEDGSVDLVIAGQAAHWFDAPKVYAEVARVLKPGGAFAFFGYGEMFLPNSPKTSALITPYSAGTLGDYWQQPGRSIVEALLTPFPFPTTSEFAPKTFHRHFFTRDGSPSPVEVSPNPDAPPFTTSYDGLVLTHDWDLKQIEGYLRTWSSAFSYDEQHGGDVVKGMMEKIRAQGEITEGDKVKVAWELTVMSGRKKE